MSEKKRVLFLVPYPLRIAPSQRFRVELFFPILAANNIEYRVEPFLDSATFSILYSKASFFKKGWGVLKGFLKRFWTVFFVAHNYKYIYIHREASPVGPPLFEFFLSKVFRKKIIYDFDDAIWIPDSNNKLLNCLKAFWKVKCICRWAYWVVGGNEYLCNFAMKYNSKVVLIPTCVDMERQHLGLKKQEEKPLTIGWTGSHSTLKYLEPMAPLLNNLAKEFSVRVLVICNKKPSFFFDGLDYIEWNEVSEVEDLLKINIGLMPLSADSWSEGKCGFKLIQYLSLGIPVVASPVGVNRVIVEKNVNGFLCSSSDEWYNALAMLLRDQEARTEMGKTGKAKIENEYSLKSNWPKFISLFS